MKIIKLNSNNTNEIISEAVKELSSGNIIVLPFDTTYGYICDPRNESALLKIFQLKKRGMEQTIGTAVNNFQELKNISEIDKKSEVFIQKKSPGKFTFILNNRSENISNLCLRNNTIAVRIPDSRLILKIAENSGGIIAQTSANVSGKPNCNSIDELRKQLDPNEFESIDLVIDGGKIESSGSSQIFNLTCTVPQEIERK